MVDPNIENRDSELPTGCNQSDREVAERDVVVQNQRKSDIKCICYWGYLCAIELYTKLMGIYFIVFISKKIQDASS